MSGRCLHTGCSHAEHEAAYSTRSGHRCSEVSPSFSHDAFCHRFSPTLNLCTHIPTPYLALSLLYSSLVLCNTHLLYWPAFYPGHSNPKQGRRKKKNDKQHLPSQNKSIFLPKSSSKVTYTCQVSSACPGRGNFSDSTSLQSIISASFSS